MGPTGEMQVGPTQKGEHKSLACCVAEESFGKEEEKDEEVTTEKEAHVVVEEELEEVDLGSDLREPRPIQCKPNRKREVRTHTVVERIQKRFCLGLQ